MSNQPWRQLPAPFAQPGRAVVIGGGLAGCCAAYSLSARGWKVRLVERRSRLAGEASGNPAAAVQPLLSLKPSPLSRFHEAAYRAVLRRVARWEGEAQTFGWRGGGVAQLPVTARLRRQLAGLAAAGIPPAIARAMDAIEARRRGGLDLGQEVLFFEAGGLLDPAAWCRRHAQRSGITLVAGREAARIERCDGGWRVWDAVGNPLGDGEVAILANAHEAKVLAQTAWLPITRVRGQIALVSREHYQRKPAMVIGYHGYVAPVAADEILLGATWSHDDDCVALRAEDHEQLLARARRWLPDLGLRPDAPLRGRVAFRSQSPDHLPLVGPVPDARTFASDYYDLHHGRTRADYPVAAYIPGLFLSLAHGGRGVASACLAGEILAAQVCGGEPPVPEALVQAVNPARFLIRHLQKSPAHRPVPFW